MSKIPTCEIFKDGARLIVNQCDLPRFTGEGWKTSQETDNRQKLFEQAESLGLKPRKNATEKALATAIEKALSTGEETDAT